MDDIDRTPFREAAPPAPQQGPGALLPFVWREVVFESYAREYERSFEWDTTGKALVEKVRDADEGKWTYTWTLYPTGRSGLVVESHTEHEEGYAATRVEITEDEGAECWHVEISSSGRDCDGDHGTDRKGTSKGGTSDGAADSWVDYGQARVYDAFAQAAGY